MTDPTSTGSKLLEQARAGHDPSAEDEARVRNALHARVLANPLLLAGPSTPTPATNGVAHLTWGKAVIALGLGGAAIVGAVVVSQGLGSREPARPARQATAAASAPAATASAPPSRVAPASAEPAGSSKPVDLPAPSTSQKRPSALPSASAALSTHDMQLEISGLSRAQQLLHSGNAARALSTLAQLSQQVPRGALMEEREATRALAQCAIARSSSTAKAFVSRYPKSVHAARVRSACERAD